MFYLYSLKEIYLKILPPKKLVYPIIYISSNLFEKVQNPNPLKFELTLSTCIPKIFQMFLIRFKVQHIFVILSIYCTLDSISDYYFEIWITLFNL